MRVDHPGRVINRDETRLRKIEQLEEFLNACGPGAFTAACEDGERHGHISRVLLRFDYPGRNKRERGVVLRYLQHTSGYSRAQLTRLVARWQGNRLALVPLVGGDDLPKNFGGINWWRNLASRKAKRRGRAGP